LLRNSVVRTNLPMDRGRFTTSLGDEYASKCPFPPALSARKSRRICRKPRFELTSLANTLRSDVTHSLRPFALCYGERWWWNSLGELLHSVKTGETGFSRAHGMAFFDYLEQHPEVNKLALQEGNANLPASIRIVGEPKTVPGYHRLCLA
jgi:hypothetical protein